MKNKLLNIFLSAGITALLACMGMPCYSQNKKKAAASPSLINSRLYSAETAYDDISLFKSLSDRIYYKDSNGVQVHIDSVISAFTISSQDLLLAMGIPEAMYSKFLSPNKQYDHIRAYLGLTQGYKFKLFLVPVIGFANTADEGQDMVLDSFSTIIEPPFECLKIRDCLKDLFVLDLNTPCPNYCNFTSPFRELGTRKPAKTK